jgi:hypothetical protein
MGRDSGIRKCYYEILNLLPGERRFHIPELLIGIDLLPFFNDIVAGVGLIDGQSCTLIRCNPMDLES